MRYKIISEWSAEKASEKVNALLKDEWELFGELHVNAYFANYGEDESENVINYSQALIKKDENKNK